MMPVLQDTETPDTLDNHVAEAAANQAPQPTAATPTGDPNNWDSYLQGTQGDPNNWNAYLSDGGDNAPGRIENAARVAAPAHSASPEQQAVASSLFQTRALAKSIADAHEKLNAMPDGEEKTQLQQRIGTAITTRNAAAVEADNQSVVDSIDQNTALSGLPQLPRRMIEGGLELGAAIDAPILRAVGAGKKQNEIRSAVEQLQRYNNIRDEKSVLGQTIGPMVGQLESTLTTGTLSGGMGGLPAMAAAFGVGGADRVYTNTGDAWAATRQGVIDSFSTYLGGKLAGNLGGTSGQSAVSVGSVANQVAESSGLKRLLVSVLTSGGQNAAQELLTVGNELYSGQKVSLDDAAKRIAQSAAMGAMGGAVAPSVEAIHEGLQGFRKTFPEAIKGHTAAQEMLSSDKLSAGQVDTLTNATTARQFREATGLEKTSSTFRDSFTDAVAAAKELGQRFKSENGDVQPISDFRRAVRNFTARNQRATQEVETTAEHIREVVPDESRRAAITNYIEAGGDSDLLAHRAAESTDPSLAAGYEAARSLTPEETAIADDARRSYSHLLDRAREYDLPLGEAKNYVNHDWNLDNGSPLRSFMARKTLSTYFRSSGERTYDSYFDGEQHGLVATTKDIGNLLPSYMKNLSEVLTAKEFVRQTSEGKASDGRPLLAPAGVMAPVGDETGKATLVMPQSKPAEVSDYVRKNHSALQDWRFRLTDETGNPVMVKGDLVVHPEVSKHFDNLFGQSIARSWYNSPSESVAGAGMKAATKFLVDDLQQYGKQTMLGFLSPFHQLQLADHALGHRVNPLSVEHVDLVNNSEHYDAAIHGLMLRPDRVSLDKFTEGVGGGSKNLATMLLHKTADIAQSIGLDPAGKAVGAVADLADRYQHYLFHDYIPSLKMKTYTAMLERNMARFAGDIEAGHIAPEDVKHITADQVNSSYGHLNYADLGRNPTWQHVLQMTLLAPDFFEARGRFTAQAVQGAFGPKGREQLQALALIGAVQFAGAKILSKVIGGDWHFDKPFEVVAGGRSYGLRSVPADIAAAGADLVNYFSGGTDYHKFASGRMSPMARLSLETLTGTNYRGEKSTAGEALVRFVSGTYIPITLQPLTRLVYDTDKGYPVSKIEQMIGSMGLHVSRFSPDSKIRDLSAKWLDTNGPKYGMTRDNATYPISQYRQLKYHLEDEDIDGAAAELLKLRAANPDKTFGSIIEHANQSLHHPFTGTKRTDGLFKQSLSDSDRQEYDAALTRRAVLAQRLNAAAKQAAHPAQQ